MTTPIIRVLLAEDNAADVSSCCAHSSARTCVSVHRVVDSEESFTDALHSFAPDVILSDFSNGGLRRVTALALARECAQTRRSFSFPERSARICRSRPQVRAVDYVMKTKSSCVCRPPWSGRFRTAGTQCAKRLGKCPRGQRTAQERDYRSGARLLHDIDAQGCVDEFNPARRRPSATRATSAGKELAELIIRPACAQAIGGG